MSIKLSTMQKFLAAAAVAACLVLSGCGKKDADAGSQDAIVGKWDGSLKLSEKDKKDPNLVDGAKKIGKSVLEFKGDHSFAMPQVEGTWTLAGDIVSMQATKMNGKTMAEVKEQLAKIPAASKMAAEIDKPMKMKLEAGGKTLTLMNEKPEATSTMVFQKEAPTTTP